MGVEIEPLPGPPTDPVSVPAGGLVVNVRSSNPVNTVLEWVLRDVTLYPNSPDNPFSEGTVFEGSSFVIPSSRFVDGHEYSLAVRATIRNGAPGEEMWDSKAFRVGGNLLEWADETMDRNVLPANTGVRGNRTDHPMDNITGIVLHHDGGANHTTFRTADMFKQNWASGRTDPDVRRSGYHFVIGQDGSVSHLVPINERTIHAPGNTPWGESANSSTVSIGFLTPRTMVDGRPNDNIQITPFNTRPYPATYDAMVKLVAYLIVHHDVPPRVTTHSRVLRVGGSVDGTSSSPSCPPVFAPNRFTDAEQRFDQFLSEVSALAGVQVTRS